jgi:hypothetical protein
VREKEKMAVAVMAGIAVGMLVAKLRRS